MNFHFVRIIMEGNYLGGEGLQGNFLRLLSRRVDPFSRSHLWYKSTHMSTNRGQHSHGDQTDNRLEKPPLQSALQAKFNVSHAARLQPIRSHARTKATPLSY